MSRFGAGLKDEIGKVVLGEATPPGTVAEAVEAKLAKIGQPGTSALAVQEETPTVQEGDQISDQAEAIEEICAAIDSRSKCYNCYKFGHFQNECPDSRRTPFRGSGNPQPTGSQPPRRSTAPHHRWNQNAVEDCPEVQPEEEEHDPDHPETHESGNYHGRPE